MAKAYSNDLRCKLLTAYDREQGSLRALSELFSVSYDWAKKISRQRLRRAVMESRAGLRQRLKPSCWVSCANNRIARWPICRRDFNSRSGLASVASICGVY